jgi:hypothetical protein
MELIREETPICRKSRRCDQCGSMIEVGSRYLKQVQSNGGLQTYRSHLDCDEAIRECYELANLTSDDCMTVRDFTIEDRPWLTEKYPYVAERLWPSRPRSD